MAGQNHLMSLPMNSKSLAPESAGLLRAARLWFRIQSCHDSVIHSLLNWMGLLALSNLSASPYLFLDLAGDGQPARFYRAFMQ
jgi:hypothetical protein